MLGKIAYEAIEKHRAELDKIRTDMWNNPEIAYREYKACDWIAKYMEEQGFTVEVGAGGVPTAVKAVWGKGHPIIGLLGELDALPGMSQKVCAEKDPVTAGAPGQACGHNLLAVAHVGGAIGNGTISFVKSVGAIEPQVGTIELVSGEIAEDIATYFAKSEQIPTVLSLGVLVDTDYSCLASGGVLIQLMPFPDEDTVDLIERNAADLVNISRHFAAGLTNEQIMEIAMRDIPYDIFDTIEVGYECNCSSQRMQEKIKSLGKAEILKMLDEQVAEGKPRELTAVCRFCNSEYTFTESDLL